MPVSKVYCLPIIWLLTIYVCWSCYFFLRMCLFTWRCLGLAIIDASVSCKLLLLKWIRGAVDLQNGNWHEGYEIPCTLALCMTVNDIDWNRKSIWHLRMSSLTSTIDLVLRGLIQSHTAHEIMTKPSVIQLFVTVPVLHWRVCQEAHMQVIPEVRLPWLCRSRHPQLWDTISRV